MIRTVITGVGGRMGGTLVRLVRASNQLQLAGVTERKGSPDVGRDVGELTQLGATGVRVGDDLGTVLAASQAQVVIDFTAPEATLAHARVCADRGVALVVGTTGLSAEGRAQL